MARNEGSLGASRLIVLAAVCVTVAALYFAQAVLIPLALAVLVSFLLAPLVQRLERLGLPRIPAVLVVFSVCLALVAILGWVVYAQMIDLAQQLPRYKDDIVAKVRSVTGAEPGAFGRAAAAIEDVGRAISTPATQATQPARVQEGTGLPADDVLAQPGPPIAGQFPSLEHPVPVAVVPKEPSPMQLLGANVDYIVGPLGTAGLVLVFVIFMLLQREDLRDRLIRLVGFGQLNITTQAMDDAARRISRYLLAQAIVNGSYGVAISIGLWLIGYFVGGDTFPNFVLWGLLCALLRFIPYLGPWLAAAFPLVLAFAVFPGYTVFITVAVMFVVVELLSNNFMEPWLYGTSTGMSTIAVLVAAVFWTWLWGPIGLVMATPLTVCLVVIGKYVPQLKFFDIMLGDEPVLAPAQRVYQRLLAMDHEEAADLVRGYLQKQSLEDVFDTVLLPALALAEQDRHAGNLNDRRSLFIRNALRQIVEEMSDEERVAEIRRRAERTAQEARGEDSAAEDSAPSARARLPHDCVVNIVILPAHDEADQIVGTMLAQLCELRGYCVNAISQNALASEMVEHVEQKDAHIVVVSALPPAAVAHARYLCKRLHSRFPDINTVVGLWTVGGDLSRAGERIACSDTVKLATTFAAALEQIHEYAQRTILDAGAAQRATISK